MLLRRLRPICLASQLRRFASTNATGKNDKTSPEDIISLFLSLPDDPPSPNLTAKPTPLKSSNTFTQPTLKAISARIKREILSHDTPIPTIVTGDALEAIEKLIKQSNNSKTLVDVANPREAATELIYEILRFPHVIIDDALLRRYFLLRPDTSRAIEAIKIYNSRHDTPLTKQTYMIPFRRCLREEDTKNAFEIINLTAASPQWFEHVKSYWKKMAGVWTLGAGSIVYLAEMLMRSDLLVLGGLQQTGVIHAMLITYLVNSTLMGFVGLASRPGDNGGKVAFRHGVFQTKWYLHAQETRMLSMIVDMDAENVENDGQMSRLVEYELASRDRRLVNGAYENLLAEYWAKQGQGFEWVEPDIDPAEEDKNLRDKAKLEKLQLSPAHHQQQLIEDQNAQWIERVLNTTTEN